MARGGRILDRGTPAGLECGMAQASRTVPERMRAIAIDRFGGPEVLTMHTLPVPVPGASEVLIAVHTAEVGGWDADMRGGWSMSGKKPRFPLVLGGGGSGTVAAVGSRVRRFKIGDPVYSYAWDNPNGGFYAEYVASPAETAAPVPAPLDLAQAGAIPIAALTAIQGIDDALHLKKGERLIILGASGGLGVFAIQFAKLRGARVLAIASGAGVRPRRGRCDCCVHRWKGAHNVSRHAPTRRAARVSERHRARAEEAARDQDESVRRHRRSSAMGASRARDNGSATPGSDRGRVRACRGRARTRAAGSGPHSGQGRFADLPVRIAALSWHPQNCGRELRAQ